MPAPLERLCQWQTLLQEPAVDRRRSDGHPALLQAFFALASAAKRGRVPPDAGEEHVLPNVGILDTAHHRSPSCNIRWAERKSRPHDGLRMHMSDCDFSHHVAEFFSHILDSWPLLVIVEREIPYAAHIHHVGPDGTAISHAAMQLRDPSGQDEATPLATHVATQPRRAPVTAHVGLPPGPASRGEPARSGGSRDRGAPGQTSGVSAFSGG